MKGNNIEPFQRQYASQVSSLIRKTLVESNSPYYPKSVINFLYDEHSGDKIIKMAESKELYVCKLENKIIGVGGLEENYIGTVFVSPEYQHQGIGKAIMKEVEAKARDKGINKVFLNSSINAVPFYKRLGYEVKKKVEQDNYGVTYEMVKQL
ncbi:MAG: GNAT family N-acetyltransferase [Promethearchaeota archaeon]|nr:MAG: GNAT family N-acetyltransferase [Candidatus Lokiarchaeota archaeon]